MHPAVPPGTCLRLGPALGTSSAVIISTELLTQIGSQALPLSQVATEHSHADNRPARHVTTRSTLSPKNFCLSSRRQDHRIINNILMEMKVCSYSLDSYLKISNTFTCNKFKKHNSNLTINLPVSCYPFLGEFSISNLLYILQDILYLYIYRE